MKPFADYVKLLVRSLSKETTYIDLDKLSFWEDIHNLKFDIEKCKVLPIGAKTF